LSNIAPRIPTKRCLSLRKYGFSSERRTREIGEIRRDCWLQVKGYIQRNVHTPCHIVETVAGV
jgi:hypothetical protein